MEIIEILFYIIFQHTLAIIPQFTPFLFRLIVLFILPSSYEKMM